MEKIRKYLLNTLLIVLVFVGVALIFNKVIRNNLMSYETNKYQIQNVSKSNIGKNQKEQGNFDFDSVKSINFKEILQSQIDSQNLPVIGGIAVPDLGINLPIFKGVSNENLAYGAGTMKEDQKMGQGNYTLASHNVTGFNQSVDLLFTPLEKAKKGMVIYITDKDVVYHYKIDDVKVVNPNHIEVIEDHLKKQEITLITCADPEAKQRIIVHGILEGSSSFDASDKSIQAAFEKKYNQIL